MSIRRTLAGVAVGVALSACGGSGRLQQATCAANPGCDPTTIEGWDCGTFNKAWEAALAVGDNPPESLNRLLGQLHAATDNGSIDGFAVNDVCLDNPAWLVAAAIGEVEAEG